MATLYLPNRQIECLKFILSLITVKGPGTGEPVEWVKQCKVLHYSCVFKFTNTAHPVQSVNQTCMWYENVYIPTFVTRENKQNSVARLIHCYVTQ